jgi:hypothetical protein
MAKVQQLLFIDTNIWLDFYRARNETGLALLEHAEAVAEKIIVTFQLESEFKRNRQTVILESMQELKSPGQIARPGDLLGFFEPLIPRRRLGWGERDCAA